MSGWEKMLGVVLDGRRDHNIVFEDLVSLLIRLGFSQRSGKGSHRIFYRDGLSEIINLQPLQSGRAKPYQVKQVRQIILNYKLFDHE
ncbi:MAG TPA: type II toxin-antitoxin system HicA family toxin [Verrucomicrobia bacterium]|nr:type II toxin-antitoxin system HicA family toxin [Verrucomicrobiota bacterium]